MKLFGRKSKEKKEATVDYHTYDSVTFKVVGTTFKNKDGEPRQEILESLYTRRLCTRKKPWPAAALEPYEYKGKTALAVYADDSQVGNIAETDVGMVSRLLPCSDHIELEIDWFEKDENCKKEVYTAEVVLYLRPESSAASGQIAAPQAKLSSRSNYTVDELKVSGYTSSNPNNESIQEVLGRLVNSRKISISFGEYVKGKPGTTYVFANNMIIGSIYKKDKAKLDELLSSADSVQLEIETTDSGPGFTDYHKPHLKFYSSKN